MLYDLALVRGASPMTNRLLFRLAEKTNKKGGVSCLLFDSSRGLATGYFTRTSSSADTSPSDSAHSSCSVWDETSTADSSTQDSTFASKLTLYPDSLLAYPPLMLWVLPLSASLPVRYYDPAPRLLLVLQNRLLLALNHMHHLLNIEESHWSPQLHLKNIAARRQQQEQMNPACQSSPYIAKLYHKERIWLLQLL